MSLDLAQLVRQVDDLGREAAQHAAERRRILPVAQAALQACQQIDPEELGRRVARAGPRWRGACPTSEPILAAFPPPPLPPHLTVIGADGSQIHPDRHAAATFYLVNIGSLALTHGSDDVPLAESRPTLGYRDQDLLNDRQEVIESEYVNARRDVAEMTELARLAEARSGDPAIALLDNGLLLWIALQEQDRRRKDVEELLAAYLGAMGRVQAAGAALGGFVDRPRGTNLLSLAHLASLPEQEVPDAYRQVNPFRRLNDREVLASCLPTGHRSARFLITSPLNEDFKAKDQEVQFFYLNTGYGDQIARVEVPKWVGEDSSLLDRLHAGLLEECRITGIPYVLVRAHELAVVGQDDRRALDTLIQGALVQQGLPPEISQKAQTKRWTSTKRRHRV
jgi:hypothetical protein